MNRSAVRAVEEPVPELFIRACDCGSPDCETIIIAMRHPVIRPFADTDELVSTVHFPKHSIPQLCRELLELIREELKQGRIR